MSVAGFARLALTCAAVLLAGGCTLTEQHAPAAGSRDEWPTMGAVGDVAAQDAQPADATEATEKEELAKQLANPIAKLISVPFQFNYDRGMGPNDDGSRTFVNLQPVIPITLDEDWNLISRTILPITSQEHVAPGSGSQSGFGDITQSFFFSPAKPVNGMVWGAGPVFLIPTATNDLLGTGKWGLGPTGVVLKQDGPWTYGALANHIWSEGGDSSRLSVNSTFLQPFLSYTTKEAVTYSLNTESTYDWNSQQWAVPINANISKVTRIGSQLVSIGAGVRWWADSAPGGPEGWGLRMTFTLLYPRH